MNRRWALRAAMALVVVGAAIAMVRTRIWEHGDEASDALPPGESTFDRPISVVWTAANPWSPALEDEYSQFVEKLGEAIEAHRCRGFDACLRDPASNILYTPDADKKLKLFADCADLPYLLRAYFAFKRKLPFGFVSGVDGAAGRDIRYTKDIHPTDYKLWSDFKTPRDLFEKMINFVHSGMYRMAPEIEQSDFYPVAVSRKAIRPGVSYYDPNGHVLVVASIKPNGGIYMLDGHPDGTLTWTRFGEALALGSAAQGGGFKAFRTQIWKDGKLTRAANSALAGFDASMQHDPSHYRVGEQPATFYMWVRAELALAPSDPVSDLRESVRALCRDVGEREEAVELTLAAGIQRQPHPAALPENIYGTEGDWESYSSPSRDARLKAEVRELWRALASRSDLFLLGKQLDAAFREEAGQAACRFSYPGSHGERTSLTLDQVLDRLFALSFDPYHCAELRWGAPAGDELARCPDGPDKRRWYQAEARLRYRIDREYGAPTPLDSGPETPPAIDVRGLLKVFAVFHR